ncbi:hypothetical protein [Streptomyces sp. NPDC001568]|uniref:hypothetical protein n=1 Tax=Streptomyces sp. NPDC001568 TaxID=3364588 RepID=UPI00369F352E
MITHQHVGTDSAGTPLVTGPRPEDDEFEALPEGTDLDAARMVRAHEVRDGDLILAHFPESEPGTPREADYFTTAYPARLGHPCGERHQCHTDQYEIGDTPDHQVRYAVLDFTPGDGCDIWLRNEPILIIPATVTP